MIFDYNTRFSFCNTFSQKKKKKEKPLQSNKKKRTNEKVKSQISYLKRKIKPLKNPV